MEGVGGGGETWWELGRGRGGRRGGEERGRAVDGRGRYGKGREERGRAMDGRGRYGKGREGGR